MERLRLCVGWWWRGRRLKKRRKGKGYDVEVSIGFLSFVFLLNQLPLPSSLEKSSFPILIAWLRRCRSSHAGRGREKVKGENAKRDRKESWHLGKASKRTAAVVASMPLLLMLLLLSFFFFRLNTYLCGGAPSKSIPSRGSMTDALSCSWGEREKNRKAEREGSEKASLSLDG